MYQGIAQEQPKEVRQPEFSYMNERFAKSLDYQASLIYELSNRVHDILNKREPTVDAKTGGPKDLNDFVSSMRDKLNVLDNNNTLLEKIISHLKEII